jgi:tRNA modification GTPase
MPESQLLQVIQLTPPGRGAVATLRVEGPGAIAAVQSRFAARSGRALVSCSPDQIVVGRFGGECGEEVVARRCNDDAVELHCHGGRAAVALIEESLVSAGCRRVQWRDWINAHHDDPIASAALAALADARTERTAAILLDQRHGAFRRAVNAIRQDIERRDAASARRRIDAILAHAKLGEHLTHPWSVVLAGRPNVGKSSLLNAMAGYGRAIVHHSPGTTRDAVACDTAIDGWPIELCDTAGLRTAGDAIEQAGIELAQSRVAKADLVILVADRSVPWSDDDDALAAEMPASLLVHNKCDLPPAQDNHPPGLSVSAIDGCGIDVLLAAIARRLVPNPPSPGDAVPFSSEQVETIRALLSLVAANGY